LIRFRIIYLYIFLLIGIQSSLAQNLTVSPYSRFGVGDLQFQGFARSIGMGQVAQGMRSNFNINPANPASYSRFTLTSFEAGMAASAGSLKTTTQKQQFSTGSFSYLAMGFPLWAKHRVGASFGLLPFSTVGYSLNYKQGYPGIDSSENIYQGRGGLSKFYVGIGKEFFKHLSIGANASYIFGQLNRKSGIYFPDSSVLFSRNENRNQYIGGLAYDAGLQYHIDFIDSSAIDSATGKKSLKHIYNLCVGATTNLAANLGLTESVYIYSLKYDPANRRYAPADTIVGKESEAGTITIPIGFSAGAVFQEYEHFTIGLDYSTRNWTSYKGNGQNETLSKQQKISGGFSWIPKFSADLKGHYFSNIEYRMGGRFEQTYLILKGTQIKEQAISVGFGFPFKLERMQAKTERARLNIGVEYVQRGTTANDLLRENFARFSVGVTFNATWFQVRKIY
jgi:hypothetical protein